MKETDVSVTAVTSADGVGAVQVRVMGVWIDGQLLETRTGLDGAAKLLVRWSAGWGHERLGWYDEHLTRVA